MTLSIFMWSVGAGLITGIVYGFSFLTQDLSLSSADTQPKKLRKEKFISFFLMATLRILFIIFLWYYVLRSPSLNIILVLVSFLAGFWTVVIKKKVLNE